MSLERLLLQHLFMSSQNCITKLDFVDMCNNTDQCPSLPSQLPVEHPQVIMQPTGSKLVSVSHFLGALNV